MTAATDEHQRTMAFADIAFGQIKALHQPASPRHFEIWYTYASGYCPSLNQTINETLARKGTLSEADIEKLHETYFSPRRHTDRIDHVNTQVIGEIDQVMAMIGAVAGNASSYSENLASVSRTLVGADEPAVRAIVESLLLATKDMERNNLALEARLKASKQEINQLQQNLEVVRHESLTDPLTSLSNRKFFDLSLVKAIGEARDKRQPLALLMTDIDHFKRFNDNYGHLTGDQVLRLVATAVKQNVKGHDIAARYGGEEFALLLSNAPLDGATTVADQIRRAVMTKELKKRSTGETLGRVTISIGVAALRTGDTPQTLIERADGCLYAAKHAGRNQVINEAAVGAIIAAKVA
jgi:diguanylate cyclase